MPASPRPQTVLTNCTPRFCTFASTPPGQHQAHVVKTIPRIGPTDWRFYGLELAEADFDAFGHTVPNESEL